MKSIEQNKEAFVWNSVKQPIIISTFSTQTESSAVSPTEGGLQVYMETSLEARVAGCLVHYTSMDNR